jgi:probable DNA repair protein
MMPALTLCATNRLAQTLRAEVPAGRTTPWQTCQAMTPGQWLAEQAEAAQLTGVADLPAALDPFAEQLLWERVIADSLSGPAAPLFDLPGMAASAAEAHALTRRWQLPPPGGVLADECQRFLAWQQEFLKRCRAGGWIDAAGQQALVLDLLAAGKLTVPADVVFAGFDRFTPFEQRLMTVLAARGCRLEKSLAATVDRGTAEVFAFPDSDAECAAVVAWAEAQLAADPACRIGVVALDLAGVRDRLEYLLADVLHPSLLRPDAGEAPRCYNFSLGRALAEQPLVRTALDLLALAAARGKVEQADLGALLLGDAWSASQAEADGRACLEAAMRRQLGYFTSLPALLRLGQRLAGEASQAAAAGEVPPPGCPKTLAHLSEFVTAVTAATSRRQLPGRWSGLFRQWLSAVGWPGDRPLSSHEYQARKAFLALLDSLVSLDALLGPVSLPEAVKRLGQLARQRLFQPETRGTPAIQVLGVLESAGLSFDALWIMGMSDERWPAPARPNPLLPAALLRQAGAPHASAEVELDFARRVHQRLLQSAPSVTFSWARRDGSRLLRSTPLLAGIPAVDACAPVLPTLVLAEVAARACEAVPDALAPAVAPGEKVGGGSWLLRAQAICPAWGFFQYRLAAEALETPVEGLDPKARGTLVHGALEAFWTKVRTAEALAALTGGALSTAMAQAVDSAIATFEAEKHLTLPARFRQLETRRLIRLLGVWLELERQRQQPFAVIACEQPATLEIEGIRINMVVDRIDELPDGRRLIIDYKTGQRIDTANWAEARITEPQLPIYAALVAEGDIAAVVFAKVLLDKPVFAGVAEAGDLLPGVHGLGEAKQKLFDPAIFPDWPAVLQHWRERLHAIAHEVKTGVAGVALGDEQGLQYCPVRPLLRLAERRRQLEARLGEVDARTSVEGVDARG